MYYTQTQYCSNMIYSMVTVRFTPCMAIFQAKYYSNFKHFIDHNRTPFPLLQGNSATFIFLVQVSYHMNRSNCLPAFPITCLPAPWACSKLHLSTHIGHIYFLYFQCNQDLRFLATTFFSLSTQLSISHIFLLYILNAIRI